ncbi:MAG TPA: Rieske (2Fe-2S) protein [Casimicrobiaceae bacterium]|nr:Rieske (2Fe-2S) protein [Casimicrobiaceae bacterium]
MRIEPTVASYTEGDAFQAEKRALFGASWLPVCHRAELGATGSFTAQTIGGWPVFAVRGEDDAVRVFRNVCRHQGMQVVEKSPGKCAEFRCRYHGWTYDLAGRFVTAPDNVAPADRSSPEHNLVQLASVDVHGFVLCSVGARSGTLDAGEAAWPDPDASRASVTSEIACNWKTYLEHRLLHEDASLVWPLLITQRIGSGVIAEQVVPRTFLRTRVVFHATGVGADALAAHVDAVRSGCEALQRERAAGSLPVLTDRVGAMWARIGEALAHDVPPPA